MFQQRHYETVAAALRGLPDDDLYALEAKRSVVRIFKGIFARDNVRFSPERFEAACYPALAVARRSRRRVAR